MTEGLNQLGEEALGEPNHESDQTKKPFKPQIVWFNAIGFFILYIATVYGLYLAFFSAKLITVVWTTVLMYYVGLSTTMGAHRLYTHRTFKVKTGVEIVLLIGQTLAAQNCLWVWVRDHRQHHKYADTDADPHNSSRGFFFSHVGWLMFRKHPEVFIRGRGIDMSDLNANPLVMFQKKYYNMLFLIIGVIIPMLVPYSLWGESLLNLFFVSLIVRINVTNNLVWLVNSWAHYAGEKPYNKDIASIDSPWVSLLCLGEGWHNFHHTFPWDYRAGEIGKTPNITTTLIDFCAKKGWVYNLKTAHSRAIAKKIIKEGDGSHPFAGKNEEEIVSLIEEKLRRSRESDKQEEEDLLDSSFSSEKMRALLKEG